MFNSKSNESNAKRFESLQKIRDEYNLKRKLVSTSLKELDTKIVKNKKIIFDEEDDDDHDDIADHSVQSALSNETKNLKNLEIEDKKFTNEASRRDKNEKSSKKLLMSSSDDSNSESEEDTKKMLESKINLKEKEANQLIYLKSKYSNDDSRFKIDDRFIENESNDSSSTESDNENDELEDDRSKLKLEETDENGVIEKNVIGKKHIKNENIKSLKILEEITGKTIKPQSLTTSSSGSNQKESKNSVGTKSEQIVRYDPTKDDHKKFEINSDSSDESSLNSSDDDETKTVNKNADDETKNDRSARIDEDKTQFYQIDSNLKQLFSSNDAFKFKFTSEKNENNQGVDNKIGKTIDIKPNPFKFTTDFDVKRNNRYNSSSEEDDVYEEEEEEEEENDVEEERQDQEINNRKNLHESNNNSMGKSLNMKTKSSDIKPSIDNNFLPDLINSQLGKEVLSYFKRKTDDMNEIRSEWSTKRDMLVQEYKKKHKKILRIQKNKNNEKLLFWKNSNVKK